MEPGLHPGRALLGPSALPGVHARARLRLSFLRALPEGSKGNLVRAAGWTVPPRCIAVPCRAAPPTCAQNDSLATLLARLEGILGPVPRWMVRKGRYANRYYTRRCGARGCRAGVCVFVWTPRWGALGAHSQLCARADLAVCVCACMCAVVRACVRAAGSCTRRTRRPSATSCSRPSARACGTACPTPTRGCSASSRTCCTWTRGSGPPPCRWEPFARHRTVARSL